MSTGMSLHSSVRRSIWMIFGEEIRLGVMPGRALVVRLDDCQDRSLVPSFLGIFCDVGNAISTSVGCKGISRPIYLFQMGIPRRYF